MKTHRKPPTKCVLVCVEGGVSLTHMCFKSAVWGRKLAQLGPNMQRLLRLNMETVEAEAES